MNFCYIIYVINSDYIHSKGKVLIMRDGLNYSQGYNDALAKTRESVIRSIRWNVKNAVREMKRANQYYTYDLQLKERQYYLSRLTGMLSISWTTNIITSHDYVYYTNVVRLIMYHTSQDRLTTNDIP